MPLASLRTPPNTKTVQRVISEGNDDTPTSETSTEAFRGVSRSVPTTGRGQSETTSTRSSRKDVEELFDVEFEDEAEEEEAEQGEPDVNLNELARAIVPLIKRMMAVERERRAYR